MADLVEVIVGVVGRPHGIRGDVHIDLRTDEPGRRFTPGSGLRLASGRMIHIERLRWDRGRLIVAFTEHPDRTAVETLRGQKLMVDVPADELPSEPEEYFDRQLVGLRVRDAAGAEVGTITEVLHLPAQDCLSVRTPDGDVLIPFVKALVPVVDLAEGFVQVAEVAGLLEQG
ncbi:MAG: ribosome maturation factor RimM [Propionibacteriaceae bacterium]|nr:ribosome maturation factor RimM [Propionibacteriaceae bacterium]